MVKAKQKTMYFGFAKTRKPIRGQAVDKAKLKDPLLIIEKTASKVQKDIRAKGVPPHSMGEIRMVTKDTLGFVLEKGKPKELKLALLKIKKAHTLLNTAQVITRAELEESLAGSAVEVTNDAPASEAKRPKRPVAETDGSAPEPGGQSGGGGAGSSWLTDIAETVASAIPEEIKVEGDQLVALWNQFKANPNKVKNKDLGDLHKRAKKLSGHASSAQLKEITDGTKKTRAWRKKSSESQTEAKGNSKKVSTLMKEVKGAMKELKKLPPGKESDKKRAELINRVNAAVAETEKLRAQAAKVIDEQPTFA